MTEKYLICENCKNVIARFNPADIKIPVVSTPFLSKFPPEREMRPPWRPDVRSEAMKCPRCPKRVFNVPEPVRFYCSDTMDGLQPYFWDIPVPELKPVGNWIEPDITEFDQPEPGPKAYACPKCGKVYATRAYFDRYHTQCEVVE